MSTVLPYTSTVIQPEGSISVDLSGQTVEVVAGYAWIAFNGENLLLAGGERLTFQAMSELAVISAMRRAPVTINILPAT